MQHPTPLVSETLLSSVDEKSDVPPIDPFSIQLVSREEISQARKMLIHFEIFSLPVSLRKK